MLHWMYKTPFFFPSEYLGSISSQFVATCFGSDENTRANRMNCNDVDWTSETSLLWPNTSNASERRMRLYLSSSYQRTRPVRTRFFVFFFALGLVFNRIVFQRGICHGAILLISQPRLCKNVGLVASAAWSSPLSCENPTLEDYQSSDLFSRKEKKTNIVLMSVYLQLLSHLIHRGNPHFFILLLFFLNSKYCTDPLRDLL